MSITIHDIKPHIEKTVKAICGNTSISIPDGKNYICVKMNEQETNIIFHPEVKADKKIRPIENGNKVKIYPKGAFDQNAYLMFDLGLAQICGDIIPTPYHVTKNVDDTLNAEWGVIATHIVNNLEQKIAKAKAQPNPARSIWSL